MYRLFPEVGWTITYRRTCLLAIIIQYYVWAFMEIENLLIPVRKCGVNWLEYDTLWYLRHWAQSVEEDIDSDSRECTVDIFDADANIIRIPN